MSTDPLRVAYLTSGAAGMFCGSCMHDNTLAKGLIATGMDVQLIPTYTPIRTDEDNVSLDRVFFGGINVYLQQKMPLFRHLPGFLDRFLDQPWLIRKATANAIDIDARELGALAVSMLKGTRGNQRKEVKRLARWLHDHAKPELVVLTNILIGGCIPYLKEQLGVPIIVTLQGDDIFLEELPEPYQKQALEEIYRLVPHIDAFIAHSEFYADSMSQYLHIPREKIHVTPLGIDVSDFDGVKPKRDKQAIDAESATIGYLARLAPEKGLHVLVDAFIEMQSTGNAPHTQLKIAGWLGSHREEYANEQFDKLKAAGLGDRFEYVGSVDRQGKVDFLSSVDILCVPTVYREPKGLFVLEALACGIPCVLPEHGAFPELLRDTRGGLLVPPEDPQALAKSLDALAVDRELRNSHGEQGYQAVCERRNAQSMAESTRALFLEQTGRK